MGNRDARPLFEWTWTVDTWKRGGNVKEKIAGTNLFTAAEAAFYAAVKAYPEELITFRHGIRVIRKHPENENF